MRTFRLLAADEIECRQAEVDKNGNYLTLLLYKTARTDAQLLDETFGAKRWQCRYECIDGKMYCGIGIYDSELKEWVWKWNVGTESNTEAEKGEASDALKRAGFVWGIGTELYSAPRIKIYKEKCEIKEFNGKNKCFDNFVVSNIAYDDKGNITALQIKNKTKNVIAFTLGSESEKPAPKPEAKLAPKPAEKKFCEQCSKPIEDYLNAEGKRISAQRHIDGCIKKFGRLLCMDCITVNEINKLQDMKNGH